MNVDDTIGTNDYWSWSSLRELDEAHQAVKGSAFRAFKSLLPALNEGVDFIVLDHQACGSLAVRWQAADRLYRSSINPVLLSPNTAARISAQLLASLSR